MILDVDLAVSLTAYGKLADATFPQALENPPGFPQTHSLDDGISLLTAYRGTDTRVGKCRATTVDWLSRIRSRVAG